MPVSITRERFGPSKEDMKLVTDGVKKMDERTLRAYLCDLAYRASQHYDMREIPIGRAVAADLVVKHFKGKHKP